ncbi:MAG: protein-disulfide reductase DsbD [Proteobacteria bacterium]|nr:protein-disulfide reductase DsbD [Pseudomonadota bacterium]
MLLRFLFLLVIAGGAYAAERLTPLPPEEAFRFSAVMEDNDVVVNFTMPEDIYLYQKRILLSITSETVELGAVTYPAGVIEEDDFFGKSTVFYNAVTIRAATRGSGDFNLIVYSQGCDKQIGICYPPRQNSALLQATGGNSNTTNSNNSSDNNADYSQDEAGYLSQGIANNSIFWTIFIFFLLGVGLSFTPCVLPMLPVLLGVISGNNDSTPPSRRRIITLTIAYISGVTLSFTAFGILAAQSGQLLTGTLQQPLFLGTVAIIFVVLAASLFGAYQLQIPQFLQRRLGNIGAGGSAGGALLMGVISAIAVSPCVAAPLIGALLYIGTSGDAVVGGVALFSLALGMSVLLAVAGIAGSRVLPRAGDWMEQVKHVFGILLLAVAVWVAAPLLPIPVQMIAYGLLLITAGLFVKPLTPAKTVPAVLVLGITIAAILWGTTLLIGAAAGSRDLLTPLAPFTSNNSGESSGNANGNSGELRFQPVADLAQLENIAASAGKPIMLEFYADWCVSCKEFERFTLRDERVRQRLQNTLLLRADVTDNTPADRELLKHFNLFGPPAILFYNRHGEQITQVRVIGYENAEEFITTLNAAGI